MKKAGAAIALAAVALVLLAHAPFVRSAALRYAVAVVQRNYGLTLQADRLDYNLARLSIGLASPRVSAEGSIGEPFFAAEYVSVTLPAGILLGNVTFREIAVANGRLFVHRRADGTSNLPQSQDSPSGDPPALRVDRVDVRQFAVQVEDERADFALQMTDLGFVLTPDEGSIVLGMPANLRVGARTTRISQLRGQAAFDGRALHLISTEVVADEGSMTLDGSLLVIARNTNIDLTARGTVDLGRVAQWGMDTEPLPQGEMTFRASATGPLSDPDALLDVAASRVSWSDVVATELSARAAVSADLVDVQALEFRFAEGVVTAAARLPLEEGSSATTNGIWNEVDAALALRAAFPASAPVPAAVTDGRFELTGVLSDLSTWSGGMRVQFTPGRNATGRVAVEGDVALDLTNGAWRLEGRSRLAAAVSMYVNAQGLFAGGPQGSPASLAAQRLIGTLRIVETDLPTLIAALGEIGLAQVPSGAVTSGSLEAALTLGGTIASPTVDGEVLASDVAGRQGSAAEVTMSIGGRPAETQLDMRLDAPSLLVAGQALRDVRATGALDGSTIVLSDLSAAQEGAPGVVTGNGVYDTANRSYTIAVGGTDWLLMTTTDQPLGGQLDLKFEGSGTIDLPRGSGEVRVIDATWSGTALGNVDASVVLEERRATVDGRAPDLDVTATGQVQIDAPYIASLTANAGRLDLARALQGVETPAAIAGTVGLVVRFDGPLEAWRTGSASLEVTSLDATAGALSLSLPQPARMRYGGERVAVESLDLDVGETRLSATGEMDAFEPARASPGVLVTLTGEVGEVARAAAATGLTEVPVEGGSGPVALLARISGSLESPVIAADLEVGPGSITMRDLPPLSGVVLRAHAENGWLELREAEATYQNAGVTVTGRVPLSWVTPAAAAASGDATIHARATNLTPAILEPFLAPTTTEQLEGSIDATLDASSAAPDLSRLTGELRLDRLDIRIADLPVTQREPTLIVARDGFARIESWDWIGQGATLNVRGQVRLEDRQTAILAGGLVDLRMLTPFVREAGITTAGRLEPRLSITGPLDDPRVDGDLTVVGGEVRLADPRVIAADLAMRSVVSRTSVRITSLTGTVNGGTMTGSGGVDYSAEQGLSVQLSTSIEGMALEFPQGLRSEVDSTLDLALAVLPQPAGRLSGTVTMVRGSYREPLAVVADLLAGARAQRLASDAAGSSPLLEALALDIQLLTDEDVIVNNNYGRLQLGGDLQVAGTAATPGLTGRADLREGGQLFVGRNVYAITYGTIDFINPSAIEPVLNVQANTRAGGEDIEVAISGPAESLTYEFSSSSNPDLGQADLVSLLLTGRRFDDLAPNDAAFVGTQVLGNLSGEVLGFASRAVGLDTIRLGGPETTTLREDPIAAATEVDPTTRLTFGKSIGANVELTLSQSLRDGDAQTWIVDYRPARGLELRLVSDDESLFSYGFRHDVTFGGPPRPVQAGAGLRPVQIVRVLRVDMSGDLALPEERVRGALRLGPGDRFDFVAWQDDRDRLEEVYFEAGYLTARITPGRSEEADGVVLEYLIAAGPSTRIVVTGMDVDSALRTQLEAAWAQSTFDDFLQDEAAEIVRDALGSDGYLQPVVDVRVLDEGATKTLSISVEPGSQTSLTIVRIDGVDETLAGSLLARLEELGLVERAVSDATGVEQAAVDYLRTRGYLRARVTAGTPMFEEGVASLPVSVEAGPAFSIARISFEGAARLAEDARVQAVALAQGEPYDATAVEQARGRLAALYRRDAFPSAAVTVQADVSTEANSVAVTFVVNEGPQQVLEASIVDGNRAVDADVIVRALALEPGVPLTPEAVLQARTRVLDTGLFRRVEVQSEPVIEPGAAVPAGSEQNLPFRLRITVEEWPALRLRYGFELAEERPEDSPTGRDLTPGLSADVTRRTVFGRAVTVGAAFEMQRREQTARAFANTGTIFGLPIGTSLIGERSRVSSAAATLVTDRSSITWEQRARVARNLSLSYAYTFERDHTFDTEPNPFDPDVFDITINIARLTAATAWDTRNDPADAIRGSLISFSLEYAPEAAGSDIRFIREVVQAYHFRPWRRFVFASAARFGAVSPLGGQDLLISERFFAGGARTVRGVPEDSLGPRDPFFNESAGGRLLLVFNQEARVPLYRWLHGVAFIDAGNVFETPGDASLRELVGSVGFGLRLVTPYALLRADFGKTVWGAPAGITGRWTFGIGQTF